MSTSDSSTVFIVGKNKIPARNEQIRPDEQRSFLSELPARYEQAKLRNLITKSLRKVANENKEIFGAMA